MAGKKIVCLGGGAVYFKNMLAKLALMEGLKGSEITLYDIDMERAELMAKYGQRLSEIAGVNFKVQAVSDLREAVDGADFAISNIGVSGEGGGGYYKSRIHTNDILIGAKYGLFQFYGDTCGPAAMMAGFRSIPLYLDICREMEKHCPNVILFNHSNPMAILCRAMNKYTSLKNVIGICHGVQIGIRDTAEILGIPQAELDTVWIGTNHYYWFTEVYHKGKDLYPELKKRMVSRKHSWDKILSAKLSNIHGYQIVYPEDDHVIEFYPFLSQIKDADSFPYNLTKTSYGQFVSKLYATYKLGGRQKVNKEMLVPRETIIKNFTDALDKAAKDFADAVKGADEDRPFLPNVESESLGKMIESVAKGERHIHIVNIPNKGVVPNLPDTAVLEVEGVNDSHGVRGIYAGEAPLALKGLLEKIIAWQEMVVDAAVSGNRNLALQALMLDELAILPEKAEAMLDELLANSKALLPQFK